VSSVKFSFVAVNFGKPCTFDGVLDLSSSKDTGTLQVTPLCIQSREQGELIAICSETHDLPPSEIDPSTLPTESPSHELVYRDQPLKGHLGRNSPLIISLSKGLKGHLLTAITKILPANHTREKGQLTPEKFVDKLIHCYYSVCRVRLLFYYLSVFLT
jgi:hypothetical protein